MVNIILFRMFGFFTLRTDQNTEVEEENMHYYYINM